MIIQLKSKDGKDIPDGQIKVDDKVMLLAFCAAADADMTFSTWFNKCMKHYIKKHKEVVTDKSKNDLSDYEM
jgi:hypothetical protein